MDQVIEIDGSVLEGGGQILRMAISLSALLGKAVRVSKIRANRAKPGLAAQHLKGIHLVGQMCNARLEGDHLGSTDIKFKPGRLRGGTYNADTMTAGSISLLLQVALPCALFADSPVVLHLKGGTNAAMAPQIDFMSEVFRPNLEKFGGTFDLDLLRRGYYPKGGGHVAVSVAPIERLSAVSFTQRGDAVRVTGWSFVAGTLPLRVAADMSRGAEQALSSLGVPVEIESYKEEPRMAPHNCSGIVLLCETSTGRTLGGSGLGGREAPAHRSGGEAAGELLSAYSGGATVDTYTQDQLILYMALARGTSSVLVGDVTLHTKTAIYIAELLTQCKFKIVPEGCTHLISCTGIGYTHRTQ